MNIYELDWSAA